MNILSLKKEEMGYLYGAFSGLCWGIDTLLLEKIISMEPFISLISLITAGTFICCLFHEGCAVIWLGGYLAIRKKFHCLLNALKTKTGLICIVGALLGGPIGMSFYLLSIKYAGSSYTSLVTSCYPALAILLAKVFLKEKVSGLSWFGVFISFLGIAIINFDFDLKITILGLTTGILFATICILGWSFESVISAFAMNNKINSDIVLMIRESTSFVLYCLIIIPFIFKGYGDIVVVLKSKAILLLILTALFGVISYLSWYKSIAAIGVSKAISFNITYSFWVILIKGIIMEKDFSLKMFVCCFLIIGGVTFAVGKPHNT